MTLPLSIMMQITFQWNQSFFIRIGVLAGRRWNTETGELEERLVLGLLTKMRAGYRKPTWDGAAPGARDSSGCNLL